MMQILIKREPPAQHIGLAGRCTLRRAVLMCCTSGDELCPADKRPASIQRRLIWALSGSVALLRSLPAALSRSGGRNQLARDSPKLAASRPARPPALSLARSQQHSQKSTLTAAANDESGRRSISIRNDCRKRKSSVCRPQCEKFKLLGKRFRFSRFSAPLLAPINSVGRPQLPANG